MKAEAQANMQECLTPITPDVICMTGQAFLVVARSHCLGCKVFLVTPITYHVICMTGQGFLVVAQTPGLTAWDVHRGKRLPCRDFLPSYDHKLVCGVCSLDSTPHNIHLIPSGLHQRASCCCVPDALVGHTSHKKTFRHEWGSCL